MCTGALLFGALDGTERWFAGFSMAEDSRKLFVAGLPDSISEEVLKQLFEATGGTVVNVSLPKDRATGRPRGFGFVTLVDPGGGASRARRRSTARCRPASRSRVRPFQAEPPRREARSAWAGLRMGGPAAGPMAAAPGWAAQAAAWAAAGRARSHALRRQPARTTARSRRGRRPHQRRRRGPGRARPPPDGSRRAQARLRLRHDGERRDREGARSKRSAAADIRGRRLVVNLAHPKGERPAGGRVRGGYAGGGGGGGYGGGGGGFGGGGGGSSGGGGGGSAPPARGVRRAPPPGHSRGEGVRRTPAQRRGGGRSTGRPRRKKNGDRTATTTATSRVRRLRRRRPSGLGAGADGNREPPDWRSPGLADERVCTY